MMSCPVIHTEQVIERICQCWCNLNCGVRDSGRRSHYLSFFFSSRRRHTRCSRDWSSDVCSSDLLGREEFERLTGIRPRGMWPPEMAVGESVARLTTQCGVDWIVGEEDVLGRSIGKHLGRDGEGRLYEPELLYRPWQIERDGRSVA